MQHVPMDLQLFADPAPDPALVPAPSPAPASNPDAPSNAATPEAIATALMSAIESRQQRAESGVVRSMADQYGMSEAELTQILETERQRKAAQLPAAQQKIVDEHIARAHGMLIAAEVKTQGAAMGLVDPEAALILLDKSGVKVDDKGGVEGVKEALEALKASKPYLYGGGETRIPFVVSSTPGVDPGKNDMAAARSVMGLPPEK